MAVDLRLCLVSIGVPNQALIGVGAVSDTKVFSSLEVSENMLKCHLVSARRACAELQKHLNSKCNVGVSLVKSTGKPLIIAY